MIVVNRYLLPLICILLVSCFNQTDRQLDNNDTDLESFLSNVSRPSQIDTLINLGLYNLAFEAVTQSNFTENENIYFANRFADHGEFDKGKFIMSLVDPAKNQEELIYFDLKGALSKQDNEVSKKLIDSLSQLNIDTLKPINQVKLLLAKAYLYHNLADYEQSIDLNHSVLKLIRERKLPDHYLAITYRRLGNDYNDIVRNKITFKESRDECYRKSIRFYQKELTILNKDSVLEKTKVALNQITTAMLMRAYLTKKDLTVYYHHALNNLIVSNDSNFLVTRNPVYTSIALTQLAEMHYISGNEKELDSLISINKRLLNIRAFYKINSKQSTDLWEYYPQRTQEVFILFKLNTVTTEQERLTLLNRSNLGKYPNQYLERYLTEEFGSNYDNAIKNWLLLNEWKVFKQFNPSAESIDGLLNEKLIHYNQKMYAIRQKNTFVISSNIIDEIKEKCRLNNATIIDYQILHEGSLLITKIDENGLKTQIHRKGNTVTKGMVDSLLQHCFNNNIQSYQRLALTIKQKLGLDSINTKSIIVCADEFLEKLPFDALVSEYSTSASWSNLAYLGKQIQIQLIPNLSSIISRQQQSKALKIDVWTSDEDNKTLPYNEKLIDFLKDEFGAKLNIKQPEHILHILAHTHRNAENNIEFWLDTDTLTIFSNQRIKPILALLEGCSSADGKNLKSEGSINQTRNFLYHGTPSVIHAIWDADNYSSTILFEQFYHYLSKGYSVSKALHLAKRHIVNDVAHPEWSNPYYWANFQLIGADQSFVR